MPHTPQRFLLFSLLGIAAAGVAFGNATPTDQATVARSSFGNDDGNSNSSVTVQAAACGGELLYNGICLPKAWPPRGPISKDPTSPPYLLAPPVNPIAIDKGRQLFVDSFLLVMKHDHWVACRGREGEGERETDRSEKRERKEEPSERRESEDRERERGREREREEEKKRWGAHGGGCSLGV